MYKINQSGNSPVPITDDLKICFRQYIASKQNTKGVGVEGSAESNKETKNISTFGQFTYTDLIEVKGSTDVKFCVYGKIDFSRDSQTSGLGSYVLPYLLTLKTSVKRKEQVSTHTLKPLTFRTENPVPRTQAIDFKHTMTHRASCMWILNYMKKQQQSNDTEGLAFDSTVFNAKKLLTNWETMLLAVNITQDELQIDVEDPDDSDYVPEGADQCTDSSDSEDDSCDVVIDEDEEDVVEESVSRVEKRDNLVDPENSLMCESSSETEDSQDDEDDEEDEEDE